MKLTVEQLDLMSDAELNAIDVEQLDELSKATLGSYIKKAATDVAFMKKEIPRQLHNAPYVEYREKKLIDRAKGTAMANKKLTKESALETLDSLAIDVLLEQRFKKGQDVGGPGFNFAKISKKAAAKYGSKEAGDRVAGAVLKKVLAKEDVTVTEEELLELEAILEDAEQLDELSKATLGSYVKKARDSALASVSTRKDNPVGSPAWVAAIRKMSQRVGGTNVAINKLTKESLDEMSQEEFDAVVEKFEQLDELSKATLGSYIKKAAANVHGLGVSSMHNQRNAIDSRDKDDSAGEDASTKASFDATNKAIKRRKSINKSVDRLTKEDISETRFPSLSKVLFTEAFINGREYASKGLMHKKHADWVSHKEGAKGIDFYSSGSGDKIQGNVVKNDGKEVHIKDTAGKLHKFQVTGKKLED